MQENSNSLVMEGYTSLAFWSYFDTGVLLQLQTKKKNIKDRLFCKQETAPLVY